MGIGFAEEDTDVFLTGDGGVIDGQVLDGGAIVVLGEETSRGGIGVFIFEVLDGVAVAVEGAVEDAPVDVFGAFHIDVGVELEDGLLGCFDGFLIGRVDVFHVLEHLFDVLGLGEFVNFIGLVTDHYFVAIGIAFGGVRRMGVALDGLLSEGNGAVGATVFVVFVVEDDLAIIGIGEFDRDGQGRDDFVFGRRNADERPITEVFFGDRVGVASGESIADVQRIIEIRGGRRSVGFSETGLDGDVAQVLGLEGKNDFVARNPFFQVENTGILRIHIGLSADRVGIDSGTFGNGNVAKFGNADNLEFFLDINDTGLDFDRRFRFVGEQCEGGTDAYSRKGHGR